MNSRAVVVVVVDMTLVMATLTLRVRVMQAISSNVGKVKLLMLFLDVGC
jgi:hypothetical protein